MNELMSDTQFGNGSFKWSRQFTLVINKVISEFKTIMGLNSLDFDFTYRSIGGLFWIGSEKLQTGKFVNHRILESAPVRPCDAAA